MKKILLSLVLIISIISCDVNKDPEYKGLGKVQIESLNAKHATLLVDAKYFNPNDIGGKINRVEVDVFIDNRKVATVNTASAFDVEAKKDFTVPMRVNVPLSKIYGESTGILGSVLNAVQNKEVKVQYKGKLVFDFDAFFYTHEMDDSIDFTLKK